jgi:hypothetical protein
MPTQNLMAATSGLPQVLVSQQLAATETTQYTGPANSAVKIASATLTNTSGSAVCPVSLSVVKTGGSASTSNRVLSVYPLAAGDSTVVTELAGVFLGPGDFLSGIASALVQTVTVNGSPTGGTFTLTVVIGSLSFTTAAIAYNANAAAIQTALVAASIAATVTGSGPYTVTFSTPSMVSVMTHADSLTGGSSPNVSIAAATSAVSLVVSGVVFS